MKKVLILAAAVILILGCGSQKKTEQVFVEPQISEQSVTLQGEINAVQTTVPQNSMPHSSAVIEPSEKCDLTEEKVSAEETKKELQKLSELLKGLSGSEFSDIDYTE